MRLRQFSPVARVGPGQPKNVPATAAVSPGPKLRVRGGPGPDKFRRVLRADQDLLGPGGYQDIVLVAGAGEIGSIDAVGPVPENPRGGKEPAVAPEAQPPGGAGGEGGAPGYSLENLLAQAKPDRQFIIGDLIGHGSAKKAEQGDRREHCHPEQHRTDFPGSQEQGHNHHQHEPGDEFDGRTHGSACLGHSGSLRFKVFGC